MSDKKISVDRSTNEEILTAVSVMCLIDYTREVFDSLGGKFKRPDKGDELSKKVDEEKYNAVCNGLYCLYGLNFFSVSSWDNHDSGDKPLTVGALMAVITPIQSVEDDDEAYHKVVRDLYGLGFEYAPENIQTNYIANEPDSEKPIGYVTTWIQWINEVE